MTLGIACPDVRSPTIKLLFMDISIQTSLTGRPTTLELKKYQEFMNSMGLILNSIQGHSTIYLKKEVVGL